MEQSAVEIAASVRRGERRAVEVLDEALAAVAAGNDALGAFVHVDEGLARAAAEAVDATVAAGRDPRPFAGGPMGGKDLEDCAGMPTTHGSVPFAGRGPVRADSVHLARLRAAGAVPIGKTAAPEFGTLNFTRTKVFGVARNPWNPERTPGGSSGGSAAAVAAGLVPVATASDGGGSTRIPAAFCGLVGFKPSHGRIPNPGPTGSETAVHGLLATTVAESARHLDVTAGPDDRDRFSLPGPAVSSGDRASYEDAIESLAVAGLRARWSPDLGFARCDPEVRAIAETAATRLATVAGPALQGVPARPTDPVRAWLGAGAMDLWFDIDEGMWPGVRDDLTRYVRSVLDRTEDYPVSRYADAVRRRERLVGEVAQLFDDVDVLLTPATAVPAFAAEGPPPDGLPVGLQIVTRRHHDEVPLRLARLWEQTQPWPLRAR